MAVNWDSSYKSKPANGDVAGLGASEIRDFKENVELKIGNEHEFDYSDVPNQGMHNEGSARVLVMDDDGSAPSRTPIVNDTEIGRIRVWKTATGVINMQFYGNDTAWEDIAGSGADLTVDNLTVLTSAGALACTTLDTGQGANELYAMDQDVETTDSVTFADVTIDNSINLQSPHANSVGLTTVTLPSRNGETVIGSGAGNASSTGIDDTIIGYAAGQSLTTGDGNTIVGAAAALDLTSGQNNVIIGHIAGYEMTSGSYNVIIGDEAGLNMTTGGYNVVIGINAGKYLTTESNNVIITPTNTTTGYITGTDDNIHISPDDKDYGIYYKYFSAATTQDDVFDFFAQFPSLNTAGYTVGCFGRAGNDYINFIDRASSTQIQFSDANGGVVRLLVNNGLSTPIAEDLHVAFTP